MPKLVRERLALNPGDELELSISGDSIYLQPVHPSSPLAVESGILLCVSEVPPDAWDTVAFIGKQREQRSMEVGGL